MFTPFRTWCIRIIVLILCVSFLSGSIASASQTPGVTKSYYSPIVRIEMEKGFFLITTDSGILWIQVENHVKPHLKTLSLGDMIDVVVEFRPDNLPPILKTWKLARSESPCKLFDGNTCRTK
ncbi:MAG: hypothetical protein NPIRA02_13060 [Nitrospirales bacterium]|nr:MAG: hypothetical protein NPIRA02_13060 [Nitrospirales bacterium]